MLGYAYYKERNFERAVYYLQDYSNSNPGDIDIVKLLADCFKRMKRYSLAIKCAERIRMRNPRSIENLKYLVKLYDEDENYKKTIQLLDNFLHYNSDNKEVITLREKALKKQSAETA